MGIGISGGDAPGKNTVLLGAFNRSGDEILAFAGGFDAPLAGEIDLVSALRGAAPLRAASVNVGVVARGRAAPQVRTIRSASCLVRPMSSAFRRSLSST